MNLLKHLQTATLIEALATQNDSDSKLTAKALGVKYLLNNQFDNELSGSADLTIISALANLFLTNPENDIDSLGEFGYSLIGLATTLNEKINPSFNINVVLSENKTVKEKEGSIRAAHIEFHRNKLKG